MSDAGGSELPALRPAAEPRGPVPPLSWRRLAGRPTTVAAVLAVVAAVGETAATVVTGRLADAPTSGLVLGLALLLLGAVAVDTAGSTLFSGVVARAEGRLRADLLDATLHQPLSVLEEQGVGELLDRVDDDPQQLAKLLRLTGWQLGRALVRAVLAWVVAGLTWWPAWIGFPVVALAAVLVSRRLAVLVTRRKIEEEVAWSEHAAQFEEAVAGRDDVRSSLGQSHVVRRYSQRAREVLARVLATGGASAAVTVRTGLVLNAAVALVVVGGLALAGRGSLGVAELVTLWLLVTGFVGQLSQVTDQMPEVQAGLGALARIRGLLAAPTEPVGGVPVPAGPVDVEFRGLDFGYPGGFALQDVHLLVPAGTTCALVGRTGAGKSTLAKLVSRAVEPPAGTVLVGGQDVTLTAVEDLRRAVGVVTQRTEILAATLAENITLFGDVPRSAVEQAVGALGLTDWVESLPRGLDTVLGGGGVTLSAGEEQLVAFARLLVRDVSVVVLDEATARMDPQTEHRVSEASARLLAGRTGLLVAHRLSTTRRCDSVAVLDRGRVVQHGDRTLLATEPGPFRDLLGASGDARAVPEVRALLTRGERRAPRPLPAPPRSSLARTVLRLIGTRPTWGVVVDSVWLGGALLSSFGVVTGWLWGQVVAGLQRGETPWGTATALAVGLLVSPLLMAVAIRANPRWWAVTTLHLRLAVLRGQTMQRRLPRTPPGEVAARALDSERLVMYSHRWIDVANGVVMALVTAAVGRSLLAGAVALGVLVLSAAVSVAGAPLAGAAARQAGDARVRLGRSLVSALDAVRTVKLAAATAAVRGHLQQVDAGRVSASVRENRVRTLLGGVPALLVQGGVVSAWALYLAGTWDIATALLVTTALGSFRWWGMVAGMLITEAPIARRWVEAAAELAGDGDLVSLPAGVDLVGGDAPGPPEAGRVALERLELRQVTAVHDDGTVGITHVDLTVEAGSLVLLVGRVGAGKSSLLSALAGLVDHEGDIYWNGSPVGDPQLFLRPGQVAYVGQVPRVLSGSYIDNVTLDHARPVDDSLTDARLDVDVEAAGGPGALVGHRGVRLSGGQVQRLALARALATEAELLIADDVASALDSRTEVELWDALRQRGTTVVGSSSRRAALARADCVVVLDEGTVQETGAWAELSVRWGHLAG